MGKPNNPNEKFAEKHIQNAFRKGNAKQLGLTGYGLTHFPNSILQLTSLEKLFLGGNEFKELPKKISKLKKLRELYLFNNNLKKLPDSFGELNQLRQLHLGENKLQELPDSFRNLKSLTLLKLHGNENLGMPPEILGDEWGRYEEGKYVKPSDIIDYYFRLKAGSRPLNEAKLILLGRGEVGKTSLVNRLVHNKFNPTTMTQGISITQWPIVIGIDNIRLNIWDFGGQEIQHSTHQFFLTERSLYLVVLNGRAGAHDEDAEYWLKFVKTFGGSSPTIVVLNKSEIQPFEVNRRALIEKYPFIHSFVVTDCLPDQNEGISLLRENIKAALNGMDHIRAKFPVDWFRIKERLANLESPFISFGEYRKICNELGEKTLKAQEALARFLNALGIALNYRDDPKLRDESVLNPHWITQGVYKIITSKTLVDKHGELQLSDLNEILDPQNYPKRMHGFILELMRKFELCFLYHDDPAEQRYLVPELLGKEQPELKDQFPPTECLNFRYDYKLMPEGILPRFITRTHTMSDKNERWRTGVVLRWEGCRAIVKADKQDRQVVIRVLGKPEKRRRLMAVIRENFDQIHSEMKEFRPTEWLGLEGHPEEWLDRQELEVFEKQKETQIRKRVGEKVLSVDVTKVGTIR